MSAAPTLRVHPHPRGPWLVRRGGRHLGVSAALGARLQAWDGTRLPPDLLRAALVRAVRGSGVPGSVGEHLAARLLEGPRRSRGRGPWLRAPLLPAGWVAALARPLVGLAGTRSLIGLAVVGAVGLAWAWPLSTAGRYGPAVWLPAAGLALATSLLHEFAHAAALLRGGYPPGAVGVGVVFVLPVLWCDVTAVALLPRSHRLRVDLAGPAVQWALAGALAAVGRLGSWPPATLAAGVALAAVAWSLLPFIRSDGFWFLSDLSGTGDLDRPAGPDDSRRQRLLLVTYRLAHKGFLLLLGSTMAWRFAARGGYWWAAAALVAGGAVFLVLRRDKAGAPPQPSG